MSITNEQKENIKAAVFEWLKDDAPFSIKVGMNVYVLHKLFNRLYAAAGSEQGRKKDEEWPRHVSLLVVPSIFVSSSPPDRRPMHHVLTVSPFVKIGDERRLLCDGAVVISIDEKAVVADAATTIEVIREAGEFEKEARQNGGNSANP